MPQYERPRSWSAWFDDYAYCYRSRTRGESEDGSVHPLSHVRGSQCYEWLRQDCAALELARQEREDSVVGSITNISSTALLAIPGLVFGVGITLPTFEKGWALYSGFAAFGVAMAVALWEQIKSCEAYGRQSEITTAFYLKQSPDRKDQGLIDYVNNLRKVAIGAFALALLLSAYGLTQLRKNDDGKSVTPAPAATSASASAAPTPTTAAATTAAALPTADPYRRSGSTEVGTRGSPAASSEEVNGQTGR